MSASQQLAFQLKAQVFTPDLYLPDGLDPDDQTEFYDKALQTVLNAASFATPIVDTAPLDLDSLPLRTC